MESSSIRNQTIDLLFKSMDLRHERVKRYKKGMLVWKELVILFVMSVRVFMKTKWYPILSERWCYKYTVCVGSQDIRRMILILRLIGQFKALPNQLCISILQILQFPSGWKFLRKIWNQEQCCRMLLVMMVIWYIFRFLGKSLIDIPSDSTFLKYFNFESGL